MLNSATRGKIAIAAMLLFLLLPLTSTPALATARTKHIRIAVVNPIFTAAAYSSFYRFFSTCRNVAEGTFVKQDISLLKAAVDKNGWGYTYGLYTFIQSGDARQAGIVLGDNTFILTDIEVNNGGLFDSKDARMFDVVILGFTEYVTSREYASYKHFVETGGKLILLTACNFVAEVSYDPTLNQIQLVEGHGWVFNGTAAWKGPFLRWYKENTNWIGSEYELFYTEGYHIDGAIANTSNPLGVLMRDRFGSHVLSSYHPHEENVITNSTDEVILYWLVSNLSPRHRNLTVAAYEHYYRAGTVIHTGVFGTDIIAQSKEMQFFLLSAIGPIPQNQSPLRNPFGPALPGVKWPPYRNGFESTTDTANLGFSCDSVTQSHNSESGGSKHCFSLRGKLEDSQ